MKATIYMHVYNMLQVSSARESLLVRVGIGTRNKHLLLYVVECVALFAVPFAYAVRRGGSVIGLVS